MAFDEALAQRIRDVLKNTPDVTEKRMFGGIAFMLGGHMFAGIVDNSLMARIGPAGYAAALAKSHVREMDFTGRPLRGYVYIDAGGIRTARDLGAWITKCMAFVGTLQPKKNKAPGKRRARSTTQRGR